MVMARGLIVKWKMPIYVAVDTCMSLELLWKIVGELEVKGFRVWGVSFDLGNKQFQKEFGLNKGVYKTPNLHAPERHFYFNPDPPHGLKRLRDNCLEKTFLLPSDPFSKILGKPTSENIHILLNCGDYISLGLKDFKEIVDADCHEFKMHWKLTLNHLEVATSSKCTVSVAAQTFSSSTAVFMRLDPTKLSQAAIVQTVNDVSFYKY